MRELILCLAALLGACSSPPAPPAQSNTAQPSASSLVLSVLGTPFLIAAKIPICAATLAVAAPVAGLSETVESGAVARRVLADGVTSNCGPPYVLTP